MIHRVLAAVVARLRPSGSELYELVTRETDPKRYREFEQLAPGPAAAAAVLVALGICGVLAAPFRLLARRR